MLTSLLVVACIVAIKAEFCAEGALCRSAAECRGVNGRVVPADGDRQCSEVCCRENIFAEAKPLERKRNGASCKTAIGDGSCQQARECWDKGALAVVSQPCRAATSSDMGVCCVGGTSNPAPAPKPQMDGVECRDTLGNSGKCSTGLDCLLAGFSPVNVPGKCQLSGVSDRVCCIGASTVAPSPAPPAPLPKGNTCSDSFGSAGVCKTLDDCFQDISMVPSNNPDCGNDLYCCAPRFTAPTPPPTQAPFQPPDGSGPTRSQNNERQIPGYKNFKSDCFTEATHRRYLNSYASAPTITFGVTAYVEKKFLATKVTRGRVARTIDSANELFAKANIQFGDLRVEEMPDSVAAVSNNPDLLHAFKNRCRAHARTANPGRITIYFHQFLTNLAGELLGSWPHEFPKAVDEPTLFMTIDQFGSDVGPWFSDNIMIHEIGHMMGLFHTFQDFPNDLCNDNWSGDIIPDTDTTLRSHAGCGHQDIDQCSGQLKSINTWNLMSYGSCRHGTPLTVDQFARMRCNVENHMTRLQRAGSRTGVATTATGRVVSAPQDANQFSVMPLFEGFITRIGGKHSVRLDVAMPNLKAYIYPTTTVRMPSKSELEQYAIEARLAPGNDKEMLVEILDYKNGKPIDRGQFVFILVDGDISVVTTVFTIETDACEIGPNNWGLWRTRVACSARGDKPSTQTSGSLVCCEHHAEKSALVKINADETQRVSSKMVIELEHGFDVFWGEPITIKTIKGQKTTSKLLATSHVDDEQFDSAPTITLEGAGRAVVAVPAVTRPGTFNLVDDEDFVSEALSIVPRPCRVAEGDVKRFDVGYCLPERALESGSKAVCTSGAVCKGLAVNNVQFRCCEGENQFKDVLASSGFRDNSGLDASAATASLSIGLVVAALLSRF